MHCGSGCIGRGNAQDRHGFRHDPCARWSRQPCFPSRGEGFRSRLDILDAAACLRNGSRRARSVTPETPSTLSSACRRQGIASYGLSELALTCPYREHGANACVSNRVSPRQFVLVPFRSIAHKLTRTCKPQRLGYCAFPRISLYAAAGHLSPTRVVFRCYSITFNSTIPFPFSLLCRPIVSGRVSVSMFASVTSFIAWP